MSAHAFCGSVISSALIGANRVMSSARLKCGTAIKAARQAVTRYLIVFLPVRCGLPPHWLSRWRQIYPDGGLVQWGVGGSAQPSCLPVVVAAGLHARAMVSLRTKPPHRREMPRLADAFLAAMP